jgi:hypothetical protein
MKDYIRNFSLALVPVFGLVLFTPTNAQAACFWVYCWDDPPAGGTGKSLALGLGAIIAIGNVAPPNDPSV